MENKTNDNNNSNLFFSEDEKKLLIEAGKKTIVFDSDCPETTPEKAKKFKRVNPKRSFA